MESSLQPPKLPTAANIERTRQLSRNNSMHVVQQMWDAGDCVTPKLEALENSSLASLAAGLISQLSTLESEKEQSMLQLPDMTVSSNKAQADFAAANISSNLARIQWM